MGSRVRVPPRSPSKIKYLEQFLKSPKIARVCTVSTNQLRPRGIAMSDQDDWDFAGEDDARAKLRAAMAYLLKGTTGMARHAIALEIMDTLRQVANGWPPGQPDPLDDDLPGG